MRKHIHTEDCAIGLCDTYAEESPFHKPTPSPLSIGDTAFYNFPRTEFIEVKQNGQAVCFVKTGKKRLANSIVQSVNRSELFDEMLKTLKKIVVQGGAHLSWNEVKEMSNDLIKRAQEASRE